MENMHISGIRMAQMRKHSVEESIGKKYDKQSGSNFKEIFDSEIKNWNHPTDQS